MNTSDPITAAIEAHRRACAKTRAAYERQSAVEDELGAGVTVPAGEAESDPRWIAANDEAATALADVIATPQAKEVFPDLDVIGRQLDSTSIDEPTRDFGYLMARNVATVEDAVDLLEARPALVHAGLTFRAARDLPPLLAPTSLRIFLCSVGSGCGCGCGAGSGATSTCRRAATSTLSIAALTDVQSTPPAAAQADTDPDFDRTCFKDGDSFKTDLTQALDHPLTCEQSPSSFRAYASRQRWIRTAYDSYFAAMTYATGITGVFSPSDLHDPGCHQRGVRRSVASNRAGLCRHGRCSTTEGARAVALANAATAGLKCKIAVNSDRGYSYRAAFLLGVSHGSPVGAT